MWEVFKDWIFAIIQFFYSAVGDWGMAILIVTIIFRILVTPLMHKSAKSNYQMQKVQPLMMEIQTKFADDPVRQRDEMQKLYAETKFNPLSGCLPMLLQIPIFMALYQVLYTTMADRAPDAHFYNLVPSLITSPSSAWVEGFGAFIPYLILMVVFAGATFVPMLLQQTNNNNPQRNQTLIMAGAMSLFMLFIGWSAPAGVLLFWGASSLIGILQNRVSLKIIKSKDETTSETIEVKPVEVDVTRKVKKPRPKKKR